MEKSINQHCVHVIIFRFLLVISFSLITYMATTSKMFPIAGSMNDKLNHLFAFYALAFLTDFSFPHKSYIRLKIPVLLAYGLLIELIQAFLPFREFSLYDVAADSLGLIFYGISIPLLKQCPILNHRWKSY